MSDPLTHPVCFLVFNRPELTSRVFQALREARPPRLYVAADGPRDIAGEDLACEAVRRVVDQVDWDCEVYTLFQEQNLGCRRGVQTGIDWFFDHEEAGIILEDDCLPDPSFFPFVSELLDRFHDEESIKMISGDYFAGDNFPAHFSYSLTHFTHIWGWASWRRAWAECDQSMPGWEQLRSSTWLEEIGGSKAFARYWTAAFDGVANGTVDTWDYAWQYAVWRAQGLVVQPTQNLVTNLGFGSGATHTQDASAWRANLGVVPMELPLKHPTVLMRDEARDTWADDHVFGIRAHSGWRRLGAGLKRAGILPK